MRNARLHHVFDAAVWTAALGFLVVFGVHEAHAGSHRFDPGPAVFQTECGSCHVAYPPALLSGSQWATVLGRLDRHYGVDASVEPATLATLRTALGAAAAPASDRELPRISTQAWFMHEHGNVARRVPAPAPATAAATAARARPSALPPGSGAPPSLSDCAACHTRAAAGDYSESSLRVAR